MRIINVGHARMEVDIHTDIGAYRCYMMEPGLVEYKIWSNEHKNWIGGPILSQTEDEAIKMAAMAAFQKTRREFNRFIED